MNLVFAHGLFGFREKLGFKYFRGVEEHFLSASTHVLVTEVSPAASIEHRGDELRSQILKAFENRTLDSAEKAHIIGHSMGGLDARFVLSKANPNNISSRIASLTTIGTPHQGSFVANLVTHVGVRRLSLFERVEAALDRVVKDALDFAGIRVDDIKKKLDDLGISLEGIANLTTDFMKRFNRDH